MTTPQALALMHEILSRLAAAGLVPSHLLCRGIDPATPLTDLGLDSLGKLTLIAELESILDANLDDRDIARARTAGDIADLLARAKGPIA